MNAMLPQQVHTWLLPRAFRLSPVWIVFFLPPLEKFILVERHRM
jgi:hypothetical protein